MSLLLLCWHSELERKRFLISKKVPMEEKSSKLLSQKKISSLSKTVSSFEQKNYSEHQTVSGKMVTF